MKAVRGPKSIGQKKIREPEASILDFHLPAVNVSISGRQSDILREKEQSSMRLSENRSSREKKKRYHVDEKEKTGGVSEN